MKLRYILWACDDVFDYLAAEKIVRFAGNALARSSDRVVSCCIYPHHSRLDRRALADRAGRSWPLDHRGFGFSGMAITPEAEGCFGNAGPPPGWSLLCFGLLLMFLARTQGVLAVETLSVLPVIAGCILISAGWPIFRILAFPVGFLIFAVPAPDWIIDAATIPLKVLISDLVTRVLYAGRLSRGPKRRHNYDRILPTAGEGRLLGLELDLPALSAIGVFYADAFRWD